MYACIRTITNSALVLQATEEPAEKLLLFSATLFCFCTADIFLYIVNHCFHVVLKERSYFCTSGNLFSPNFKESVDLWRQTAIEAK